MYLTILWICACCPNVWGFVGTINVDVDSLGISLCWWIGVIDFYETNYNYNLEMDRCNYTYVNKNWGYTKKCGL